MEICISTQGINLGGDVGLTIGINEKWNWRIKKKYYEWKKHKIGQKLRDVLRYKVRIIWIEINCANPLNFIILWEKKG